MDAATERFIRGRARHRCEYCHLPQDGHEERFSIDHVIAKKHRGTDENSNIALACLRCNLHKGANLSGIDPLSGQIVELFNPRTQAWTDHFGWNAEVLVGITPVGRASIAVMNMNSADRRRLRQSLLLEGFQF